jgi:hypothetical protein
VVACGGTSSEGTVHGNVTAPTPGACCGFNPVTGNLVVHQAGQTVKAWRVSSGHDFDFALPAGRYELTFTNKGRFPCASGPIVASIAKTQTSTIRLVCESHDSIG